MLTDEARQVLKQARALKTLSETPEWKVFIAIISAQADNFASEALRRSNKMDDLVASEWPKGVFYGLQLAAGLPSAIWEQRADILKRNSGDPDAQAELNEGQSSPAPVGKAP